MILQER